MAMRASSDPEIQKLRNNIILKPGMKIGHLTLLEKIGSSWKCLCDCGETTIIKREYRLKNHLIGNVRDHVGSCGCEQKKKFKEPDRRGGIKISKYQQTTYTGLKILKITDQVDNNGSKILKCLCPFCKQPFYTTGRAVVYSCGCSKNLITQELSSIFSLNLKE